MLGIIGVLCLLEGLGIAVYAVLEQAPMACAPAGLCVVCSFLALMGVRL